MRVDLTTGPELMPAVDAALGSLREAHHLDSRAVQPLRLILEELLVNIARHGYEGRTGLPIRLEFVVADDTVRVVVEDEAPPFNPLADAPAPDLESDLENREPGGLGIFLVQSLADRAEYRRTGQCNRLELQKAIRV